MSTKTRVALVAITLVALTSFATAANSLGYLDVVTAWLSIGTTAAIESAPTNAPMSEPVLEPEQGIVTPEAQPAPFFFATTLIDPTTDGGFESGFGTWTVVNGLTGNQWFTGTAAGGAVGTRSAFIGSSSVTYTDGVLQALTAVDFMYKDITFPGGETNIQLTFNYKQPTVDATFDNLKVFLVPTSTTPVAGTGLSSGQIGLTEYPVVAQPTFGSFSITLPASAAGTTQRLVFQWKNDAATPYGSGAIDNISLVSALPGTITSNVVSGNWSATSTWAGGVVPTANDNVVIANGATVTIDTTTATCLNLTVGQGTSGVLQYISTPASTLTVNGDVTVASGGSFNAGAGSLTTHVLNIGGNTSASAAAGNLTVNGTFDMNTTAGVTTNFFGTADGSVSGSGAIVDFFSIVMQKGTTLTPVLDVIRVITMSSPSSSGIRLTTTSGTFKLSSASTLTPYFGSQTVVGTTGRLWLNNSAAIVTVVGVGTGSGAGSPTINGTLRVDAGTWGYGSGDNQMIFGSAGVLTIGGASATVNMFGRVTFGAGSTLNMTAGNFNIDPQATNVTSSTNNILRFGTGAVTVNATGGTITIVDPHAATGAGTALSISASSSEVAAYNFTGSTVRFGNGVSTTAGSVDGFDIDTFVNALVPIGHVAVNNTATNASTRFVRAATAVCTCQATFNGDLNLSNSGGSNFKLNGNLVAIRGNLINEGTLDGTTASSRLYFAGSSTQTFSGGGVITAPLASLDMDNPSGLILTPTNQIVTSVVDLFRGTITNSNKITLGNGGATSAITQIGVAAGVTPGGNYDVAPTFNIGTGGYSLIYAQESIGRTTGPEIPPTRSITSLSVNNTNNLTIAGGDLTVTSVSTAVSATNGRIITGSNTLIFSTTGSFSRPAPGGHVDGNLKKPVTATGNLNFEVGTANAYSPVLLNVTSFTSSPTFTAKATQGGFPGITGANKLARYWTLSNTGTVTANLTFTYLAGDVTGTVANYKFIKNSSGALTTLNPTGTPTSTSAVINAQSSFSDWTLAEAGAVLPGTLALSNSTYTDSETNTDHVVNIPVNRTGGSDGAVSVAYTVTDGTATVANNDYTATASGTLNWAAGDAIAKNIAITVKGDTTSEPSETVNIVITTPGGGAALGTPNTAVLTITNDDSAPTNPSGSGAAGPSTVPRGTATLLTVSVTPGTNPTSTGIGVTADLSAIGLSNPQTFFDNGSNGDVMPGDNIFSYSATVTAGTPPGAKSLLFTITDAQARSGAGSIALTVQDNPSIMVTPSSLTFPNTTVGNISPSQPYQLDVNGQHSTTTVFVDAPSADFQVSLAPNSGFGAQIQLSSPDPISTTIYVRFTPQGPGSPISGNVTNTGGANTTNVAVSGNGIGAACTTPPGGMVSWYRAEGNADDAQGTNGGAELGSPTHPAGKVGQSFEFDGSTQWVDITDSTSLHLSSFTIDAWVNFDSIPNIAPTIFGKALGGGDADSYILWYQDGKLRGYTGSSGGSGPIVEYVWTPTFGQWYHVAYAFNGATQTLYIDGQPVAAGGNTVVPTYDSHPARIGADFSSDNDAFYFDGKIDEVELFDRALSDADILAIYNAGTQGKCVAPEIEVRNNEGFEIADTGTDDFGGVAILSSSSRGFTIRNVGAAPLTIGSVTKDGTDPNDFTVTPPATSPNLAPGASRTFSVSFSPLGVGPRSADIHLTNGDTSENTFDIHLIGNGGVSGPSSYTWNGSLSTDWTVAANWTPTRLTPNAGDRLYFNSSTPTPTVTNVAGGPTADLNTIAELHISGSNPNFSTSGANTLTISRPGGGLGLDLGSLTITGSNALTIRLANNGTTGTVSGFVSVANAGHRIIGQAANAVTFGSGSIFSTQSGFTGNAFGDGSSTANGAHNSIIFASGAAYIHNAGDTPFGLNLYPAVTVFSTGSSATFLTATGFEANGREYANLAIGRTDPSGIAVNISETNGGGSFWFDNLSMNSPVGANSSLEFVTAGGSGIFIRGNIMSNGSGSGTLPDVSLTPGSAGIQINKTGGSLIFGNDGSNARSVNLNGDVVLADFTNLTLNRVVQLGFVNPNSKTLRYSLAASLTGGPNGYVIGSVRRVFDTEGSNVGSGTFFVGTADGYSPVDVANCSCSGELKVSATATPLAAISGASKISRYWTLTELSGIDIADLTFHYRESDVAPAIEGDLRLYRYDGYFTQFGGVPDTVNNTATATGVTSFSEWTLAEPGAIQTGTVEFSSASYSTGEGDSGTHTVGITVTRSDGGDGQASVNYSAADSSATDPSDYAATSGTLTWAAGNSAPKTFNVVVNGDLTVEPSETVNLTLQNELGATLGSPSTAVLTITNDDFDTIPPETTIELGPTDPTAGSSTTFMFSGTDDQGPVTFECRLDGGGFAPCTSPYNFSVPDGSHTFTVRAKDASGNYDTTPPSFTWVVDSIPPTTSITSAPSNTTNNNDLTFTFTGNDGTGVGVASFMCDLNNGGFSTCASPITYMDQADGPYAFSVYAVDGVGNTDSSPDQRFVQVDTTAPVTTIGDKPQDPTDSTSATFTYSSVETGAGLASYTCSLDGGSPTDCTVGASVTYNGLSVATHTFDVYAIDLAGNVEAPAIRYTWRVVATATIGGYEDASVALDGNATVTPDLMPQNAARMTATTTSDFKGQLEVHPISGVVRITNAAPATTAPYAYVVTVTAYNEVGTPQTSTFDLSVTTTATCANVLFAPANNLPAGTNPSSVAVGDINGDGNQDIAAATGSGEIFVKTGDGHGVFTAGSPITGLGSLSGIAIADLNGDGKQDLAVISISANSVSVLRGDGLGGFGTPTVTSVGASPSAIAVGDINHDGRPDVVTANYFTDNVTVLINDGTAAFPTDSTLNFAPGTSPRGIAIGDVDQDGNADIIVAAYGTNKVIRIFGYGNGGFDPMPDSYTVGTGPYSVAIGNFNTDSLPDVATANSGSNDVSVLLNTGLGVFGTAVSYGGATGATSVATGDFNGDSKLDLVTANRGTANVSVFRGDGLGTFAAAQSFAAGNAAQSVAVGDFDEDGWPDIATANNLAGTASILLRRCNAGPMISSDTIARQGGTLVGNNSTIATVEDDGGDGAVVVTVTSANPSAGVTVSNIVNTDGVITADVAADCSVTTGTLTFTLQASDGTLTSMGTLTVTVTANTPPTLVYPVGAQHIAYGGSIDITPTTASDNGSIADYFIAVQAPSFTTTPTVDSNGVVHITNAQPAGTHTITVRATDNCGSVTNTDITIVVGNPPVFSVADVTHDEGNSGTTSYTFTIIKTGATGQSAQITYGTGNDSAIAPGDYTAIDPTTVTFGPSDTSLEVTIFVNGDTLYENSEDFRFQLTNPVNATVQGTGIATGYIDNDDAQPTISINDVMQSELNAGTTPFPFTVALSAPSGLPVTVHFQTANGTATTADADYVGRPDTVLTIDPGSTTIMAVPGNIPVTVNGDTKYENSETFFVNLSNATGATIADSQGLGTITNDDSLPTLSIDDVTTTNEGHSTVTPTSFTFTITKTGDSQLDTGASFATNAGITNPANGGTCGGTAVDYSGISGNFTFFAGDTNTKTITVNVCGDATYEANETFTLDLTNAVNANIIKAQGVGVINNDDSVPTFSIEDHTFTGVDSLLQAGFRVTRTGTSEINATIHYQTSNNTAVAGQDYTSTSGTLTFSGNDIEKFVDVPILPDSIQEPEEYFFIDLDTPTNATIVDGHAVGTIPNDDAVPSFAVSDAPPVFETNGGTTTATFTITKTGSTTLNSIIYLNTVDGSATVANNDYVPVLDEDSPRGGSRGARNDFVGFGPAETSKTFTVAVNGDTFFETDEIFTLHLRRVENGTITNADGTATIQNDDVAPTVQFASADYMEDESQTASVTLTRTGDISASTDVTFATVPGGNASPAPGASCTGLADYVPVSTTVTFAANATTATGSVAICGDVTAETQETIKVQLSAPVSPAVLGSPTLATLTINDTASQHRNANEIALGTGSDASPYPSTIPVSTSFTTSGNIRLTLYDVITDRPGNIDILLVAPGGQKIVLMADAGGTDPMTSPATLTFQDLAGAVLPQTGGLVTGKYEPTTWETPVLSFTAPAPPGSYPEPGHAVGGTPSLGSIFSLANPNGDWKLYVRDDGGAAFGPGTGNKIAGGWGIQFLVPTAAEVTLAGRVMTADGSGIRNATMTVSGNSLSHQMTALTSTFGYYRFIGLTAGETYIVTVNSKRFVFSVPSRAINLGDNIADADFVADP